MRNQRLTLTVVLMSLSTVGFAQSDAHKHGPPPDAQKAVAGAEPQKSVAQTDVKKPVVQSEAKKAFEKLKTLSGAWEGNIDTFPKQAGMEGKSAKVWLRVPSMGNAIMHEMKPSDMPDNPITMLYLDEDKLLLTHYCDAGNRPRMVGKISPDGKTVEFEFLDVTGNMKYGHMHRAVFTFIDENHHTEDWTFMMKGDKPVRARIDLRRSTTAGTTTPNSTAPKPTGTE